MILRAGAVDVPGRLHLRGDLDGRLAWFEALDGAAVPDAEADAYIARAAARDPDIWVIEIEHREGWHPFDTM